MVPRLIQPFAALLFCVAMSSAAHAEACRNESFKGASYTVCSFDPMKDALRIYWAGDDGRPYRTFAALANDLKSKGKLLRFAMNGGMYQDDLRPVGLYIENGRGLTRATTTTLTGAPGQIPNFYKKPNGVFYIWQLRSRHLRDGTIFSPQTGSKFRHTIRTDARDRRNDQSDLHRQFK